MSEGREMPARVTDDCPQMTQMNRAAAGCSVCNHKATINGFSARVAIVLTYVAPGDVTCRCYGGRTKVKCKL